MKKWLLISVLLGAATLARAQFTPEGRRWLNLATPVRPDSQLTVQAFRLAQHFDQSDWRVLAAQLAPRPRPVASYLGLRPGRPLQSSLYVMALMPRHPTPDQAARWQGALAAPAYRYDNYGAGFGLRLIGEPVSRHATRQLGRHLQELGLMRRQTDYERLADVLRRRAAKVRLLEKALPVLLFAVDSTGQVRDVGVDGHRSDYGMTRRSRKIILQALATERFRALEARRLFSKPHPWAERVARLRLPDRLHRAGHFTTDWLLYKTVYAGDRCGGRRRVRVPRFGRG